MSQHTPVTIEEARLIASRFIDGHFDNPRPHPRISIPANPERDDDLRLLAFINQCAQLLAALVAQEEADKAEDAFTAHMNDPNHVPEGPEGDAWFAQRDALMANVDELKAEARALRTAALAAAKG